jgi:hypothetical protein
VVANVDEIVTDSVELARRVGRDARRVADAVREAVVEPVGDEAAGRSGDAGQGERAAAAPEPESTPDDPAPLANVYAWNRVTLNRAATCASCSATLTRGSDGFVGLSDQPSDPRVWLCTACGESL